MQSISNTNLKVIDVSHHQNTITWSKVKSDGVVGAFIKATEGVNYTDPLLDINVKGAKASNIFVGLYHYARAERNDAVLEAQYFVSKVKNYNIDFPYVLDIEGDCALLGKVKASAWAKTFLETVKKLTSKPVMIYTGGSFAKSYLDLSLQGYPIWIAHYGVSTPMSNSIWSKWSVFQYTSTGRIQGISNNVDVNVMEKSFFDQYTKKEAPINTSPIPTALDNIEVLVDGESVAFGRIIDGHVYLPLKLIGSTLGVNVIWDNVNKYPLVNNKKVKNFKLIDNVSFVQIRECAEMLGGAVSFDNKQKNVNFKK